MPFYKVTFENGQSLFVNAESPDAAEAHVNESTGLVRNPRLGKAGFDVDLVRPQIDQRTPVLSVEAVDKYMVRRLAQLEGQIAAAQAEIADLSK